MQKRFLGTLYLFCPLIQIYCPRMATLMNAHVNECSRIQIVSSHFDGFHNGGADRSTSPYRGSIWALSWRHFHFVHSTLRLIQCWPFRSDLCEPDERHLLKYVSHLRLGRAFSYSPIWYEAHYFVLCTSISGPAPGLASRLSFWFHSTRWS